MARADILFQNLSASDWGEDNTTISYVYDANGSVETKTIDDGVTPETYTYQYNCTSSAKMRQIYL